MRESTTPERLASTRVEVETAARVVPQSWGLDTFVAVNPLHAFEHLPFEDALERSCDLFGARLSMSSGSSVGDRRPAAALVRAGTADAAPVVDALLQDWCASWIAGVDPIDGAPAWGLWSRWRQVSAHDPVLRRWMRATGAPRRSGRALRSWLLAWPEEAVAAVDHALRALDLEHEERVPYLEAQLTRSPGWASLMARRNARGRRDDLVEYLAVRLAHERLAIEAGIGTLPPSRRGVPASGSRQVPTVLSELQSSERAHLDVLLGDLDATSAQVIDRPLAQVVCCIDPRSEGLRRHLERRGRYETLGFAGFFALPIRVRTLGSDMEVASCPVLLEPRATLVEVDVATGAGGDAVQPRPAVDEPHRVIDVAKGDATAPFLLADATGWVLGPVAAATTVIPNVVARFTARLRSRVRPVSRTQFALDFRRSPGGRSWGLATEEQVQLAHNALSTMGLTREFATVVVFCGHTSRNRNNPFRSALDCGACGGNSGAPNARILAAICNRPEVRAQLRERNVDIGDDVWFVAAVHETTDDVVTVLDRDDVPVRLRPALAALEADLAAALDHNRAERARRLPPVGPARPGAVWRARANDPTLVVPEWGLARCAAIVIAPRSSTAALDLDRRVFLHSTTTDVDEAALEAIMTGPLVVAHWISSQYLFSTIDPVTFGAGSKPLHNVVARAGVYEGGAGDLRIGLPLESVSCAGRREHQPLRLLAIIEARRERIDAVVARNPLLRNLVGNGWISMVARSGPGDPFMMRDRAGAWRPWYRDAADPSATNDQQIGAPHEPVP